MTVRLYEWDKTETGWAWIEITDNKVVNLILRELNNLTKINSNNEVYTDLQLDDNLLSSAVLPVGVTTWRVLQANWRPVTWTLISAKTTSGDNIKILYGDDGEIRVDNGTGVWKNITTAYFKTQAEYDALPARKNTDGNLYIIVDSHLNLMPFEELIQLTPAPDAILTELNKYPKDYAEYYYENGDIRMQEFPSSQLPRADAYVKAYQFGFWPVETVVNYPYQYYDTNLTEQELSDGWLTQEQIEAILAWEWLFTPQW